MMGMATLYLEIVQELKHDHIAAFAFFSLFG